MRTLPLSRLVAFFLFAVTAVTPLFAQTPRVYLKFDGDLKDSSGSGIITSITPSALFSATYAPDRNGVANSAIVLSGISSLELIAAAMPADANQALGLRGGPGGSPFTLAAWVYANSLSSGSGYATVFGNTGTGAGTLHAGIFNNRAHLGFETNDATGSATTLDSGKWYHLAFVYDGASQRVYINGVPEVTRLATNTLKASNVLIGNWNTAGSGTNDLVGRLDDVVIFNAALTIGQIQALYQGANPSGLPAAYSAPRISGPLGSAGFWGVREIKSYPAITLNSLVNTDRVFSNYATVPGGTVFNYSAPVINHTDPQSPGIAGYFSSEASFGSNTGSNDENFVLLAKGTIRIAVEDDYTFGFRGDEGSRLRIEGATFTSGTAIGSGNQANPPAQGDAIYYTSDTTDNATLGVTHLVPGDYNIEFVYWEHNNAASCEVFAARGVKTIVDGSFQLIGNTAAGGLELVRDLDSYPRIISFTGNGGGAVVVNGGLPATFTLAWQANSVATSVTISPDIGAVANSGSQVIASPSQTTTYTITATAGADVATRTLTVYVDAPPVITSLTASPPNVISGGSVTLNWTSVGATSLTLQPGNIDVTGLTSKVLNPTASTLYTLFATNTFGTVQQDVNVITGNAPVINSFVVADANPLYGAETSLNWNVSGATSLSINQGIGSISGDVGSASIAPLQNTTYTLTATNIYGASTATATLNVATPIGVTAAGFSARKIVSSVAFPFSGQGYLQSAVSLAGGQNMASQVTQNGYATVNFLGSGNDGDFISGNVGFPGGIGDNTAVVITATLVVNTPGEYTFVLNSDDGARLRIDGQDVIVDDSTHYPGGNAGRITLSKQTAQLELIYYNATGGAEVELGWIRPNLSWQLLGVIAPATAIVRNQLLISEFMADNDGPLLDEDGAASDWIEIWNSTNATVNLAGYYLTDSQSLPNQWALPAWTLGPNEYMIVFASGKERTPVQAVAGKDNPGTLAQPHIHTNFALSKNGGSVLLTRNDGPGVYTAVSSFLNYPAQADDISYGSSDSEGYIGFIDAPTPGGPNAATVGGVVSDVTFSRLRGRYTAPFNLDLSTTTSGTTIRYTFDGTRPSLNNGIVYTGPILITSTKVVRAIAVKPGWRASPLETHTFLFVDDIVTQTATTATALGFPASAVNGQVFRYGMTLANVTSGGGNLQSLKNALAAIPTVSMSTEVGNLVDVNTGIYVNPGRNGLFWERPASMEYINAAGTSEFGINCGVRIRGGFSRATNNPKHAFHMYFRNNLYDGNLKYPLFGNAGASEFNQVDLRCEQNYSWSFGNDPKNVLAREEWSRLTQRDMGQPYARHGYFHLYLNGIYWGIYNFEERTEASYGETYLGGLQENYDVVKSAGSDYGYLTEMTDGNFAAWYSLVGQAQALKNDLTETGRTAKYMKMRGLNPDGTPNPAFPVLLDVDNLVDYELVVFFDGSFDSPMSTFLGSTGSNNWFGIRDRLGMNGFAFFAHDHEHGMESVNDGRAYNRIGPWGGNGTNNFGQGQYGTREGSTLYTKSNPHYLHEFLCFSAEYRQHFADRVQRHFFNGGALTTAKALARFNELTTRIDTFIHAEAARWGSTALNRNSWLTAKASDEGFMNNGGSSAGGPIIFPAQPRSSLIVSQLRLYSDPNTVAGAKPLFSTLLAPTVSGVFGGNVVAPYNFTLSNPNASGAIYYTTNGGDPRPIGGGAPSGAQTGASPISITLNDSATIRARIYDSAASSWSPLIEPTFIAGVPASAANLVISKIHYRPANDSGLAEFVELMNIGSMNIDLSNVRFIIELEFEFPFGYILAPGARVLVVRNMAAFTTAYPTLPAEQIAGVFANGSSLADSGERLQLLSATDAVIRDFSYDDAAPWPVSPDGDGPSLVLIRPEKNPDHGNPANWRASVPNTGAPGISDTVTYSQWAASHNVTDLTGTSDDDGDGAVNLCEFALNLDPKVPSSTPVILGTQNYIVGGIAADYLTLTYTRPMARDEIAYSVEAGSDLSAAWIPAVLVSGPVNNGDATETLKYRHPVPQTGQPKQFLRVRFTRLP